MPLRRLKDKGQGTGKKRQNEKKTYETVGSGCGSLVEQLHPTPEVHGSNSVIGKLYITNMGTAKCFERTKIKEKEAGDGPFKKISFATLASRPPKWM